MTLVTNKIWSSFILLLGCILCVHCSSPKIVPKLKSRMEKDNKVNVVVSFDGTADICRLPGAQTRSIVASDRSAVLTDLKKKLEDKMTSAQSGVLNLLSSSKRSAESTLQYSQFWITNQIHIRDADPALIQSIADDPKVSSVAEEPKIELIDDDLNLKSKDDSGGPKPHPNGDPQPNLEYIKVPQAWELLGGLKGDGILVGMIDSGVRHTHENLKSNWAGGDYSWYDPGGSNNNSKPEPYDDRGHGTHVAGFAVGAQGVGVAPNAKLMACKFCRNDHHPPCQYEDMMKCAQFMTCPTLPDGSNPDCSKAPHIINNSWGGPYGDDMTYLDDLLACWHNVGIIPVFAVGNYGVDCASAQYPGTSDLSIAAGNIDLNGEVTAGSSRGPAPNGKIKPDVVAPGKWLLGPSSSGDEDYKNRGIGTSYSAPHVAGALALLLNKNKDLTFEQIKVMLQQSAERIPQKPDKYDYKNCENTTVEDWPNNLIGYGMINVLKLLSTEPPAL